MFICLCGLILSGLSLNFLQGMDAYLESTSETPVLETAAFHPPGADTEVTMLHTSASHAALPAGKKMLCFLLNAFCFCLYSPN